MHGHTKLKQEVERNHLIMTMQAFKIAKWKRRAVFFMITTVLSLLLNLHFMHNMYNQ